MAETASSSGEEASSHSVDSSQQKKQDVISSSSIASMAEDLQRSVIESTRSLHHNSSNHLRNLQVTSPPYLFLWFSLQLSL